MLHAYAARHLASGEVELARSLRARGREVWPLRRRDAELGFAVTVARELPNEGGEPDQDGRVVISGTLATLPLREAREAFEREYLLTQINRFGGNISRTASFVGMERSALHRKLKSLGVVTTSKSGARIARVEQEDEVS